jgi:hypothetical protein
MTMTIEGAFHLSEQALKEAIREMNNLDATTILGLQIRGLTFALLAHTLAMREQGRPTERVQVEVHGAPSLVVEIPRMETVEAETGIVCEAELESRAHFGTLEVDCLCDRIRGHEGLHQGQDEDGEIIVWGRVKT